MDPVERREALSKGARYPRTRVEAERRGRGGGAVDELLVGLKQGDGKNKKEVQTSIHPGLARCSNYFQ